MAEKPLRWTHHGREQAAVRGLSERIVEDVARTPDSVVPARAGREIRQRVIDMDQRSWLVRVVVETGSEADEIVTAYRTSRIERYTEGR